MVPEGFDIDFGSEEFLRDPWTPLLKLQEDNPVFWSEKTQAWIVTRHADVIATFRDQRLSASRIIPFMQTVPGWNPDDFPLIRDFDDKWISNVDNPIHSRIRKLMMNAFSKSVVEGLRPGTKIVAKELVEEVAGREVDYVMEVARQVPARVIARMFGIPEDQKEQFADWAGKIQEATASSDLNLDLIRDYHNTLEELNAALRVLIEERRIEPKEDLLSQFIKARDEGDKLSEEELLGACHATIIAGFETTMHMLVLSLLELQPRPELQAYFLESPQHAAKAMEEILRYVGMVKGMQRMAKEDFEWHGQQIKAGDMIYGMNISANRDPRVWGETADQIDPERDLKHTAAFGPGMHFCLGHLLAKMELIEFLTELFGNYTVEILTDERPWIESFGFRGLARLPVRITRKG